MPKNSYIYNSIAIALEYMVEHDTASEEASRNITDLYSLEEYIRSGDVQKYKYNGKGLDRQYSLNLYDYEARYYDPVLGLWTTKDPLAEKYYNFSPYQYGSNNPVRFIDLDGREVYFRRISSQAITD